ncbi:hypothetical protein CDAR_203251, partial [Caerostris darwini]
MKGRYFGREHLVSGTHLVLKYWKLIESLIKTHFIFFLQSAYTMKCRALVPTSKGGFRRHGHHHHDAFHHGHHGKFGLNHHGHHGKFG